MKDFSIRLDALQHGWATIVLADQAQERAYVVSYIGDDALEGLLYSARMALRGQPYHAQWLLEPAYVSYGVVPGRDMLRIAIEDVSYSCSVTRYAKQVLQLFDRYLHRFGKDAYMAQWKHAYPAGSIALLREELRQNGL